MTTQWTFTTPEETVVWRDLGNDSQESQLASLLSAEELAAVLPYVPPPPPVPQQISRRQFYMEMTNKGAITEDEALAAMGGATPPELLNTVTILPPEQQFGCNMMLAGQVFDRTDPAFLALAGAMGWSEDEIDEFFTAAAKL
jgi:hypothetical protein